MITSEAHAHAVQARRAEAGLNGYAKAVRRYMKRTNHFSMRSALKTLPRWAKPEPKS